MGAGLTITRVLTIFLLFYVLFGVLAIFLFLDHPVFKEAVSRSNVLIVALSWPFFIYSIVKGQGEIVSFIALVIILAVGAILLWLAYIAESIMVRKDHKMKGEEKYESLAKAHESYLKNKKPNELRNKGGKAR